MARRLRVKLGKGISKYRLPNGLVIENSGEEEVDYSPNISRAIIKAASFSTFPDAFFSNLFQFSLIA